MHLIINKFAHYLSYIIYITFISFILSGCNPSSTTKNTEQFSQQCHIVGLNESIQVVYDYNNNHPNNSDGAYADNPVRPFLAYNDESWSVRWFASNSKGYCQSYGLPVSESVQDILAQIRYKINPDTGSCETWVNSRFNESAGGPIPDLYPASSYYNELWMVIPYTLDGVNVYSLVHNEYHIIPENVTDVYGNLTGAVSSNSAESFSLYQNESTSNQPVIVAPYPYTNPEGQGKGGMFAQTNIIKWGNYYYMLVNESINNFAPNAPADVICMYRTPDISNFTSWRGWNQQTNAFDIALVESYPANLTNPESYFCSAIPGLPAGFRFSWSYNVILHKFIIIGIDFNYNNTNQAAFIYTLANLDPNTGVLSPAGNTNEPSQLESYSIGLLRYVNSIESWQTNESIDAQFYPSILDPNSPKLSDTTAISSVIPGDLNFQYSGQSPYLYYTHMNPHNEESNRDGQIRDIWRQKLDIQCQ